MAQTTSISFPNIAAQLRFPMMCGIVVIHSNILLMASSAEPPMQPSADIINFLSEILTRICVPLFFFISGYFFFYGKDASAPGFFVGQWKKRVRSLLVPYILWNIFALALLALKMYGPLSHFFPRMAANPLSAGELLDAFWAFRPADPAGIYEPASAPVNTPLWFLRDLMVMVLFTPLIYRLLRPRAGWIVPMLLAVLYLAGVWFPYNGGYSLTAILFFCSGAWFAIRGHDPVEWLQRGTSRGWLCAALTVAYGALALAALRLRGTLPGSHLYAASILVGLVWVLSLAAAILRNTRRRIPALLEASAFFIYAFHAPVLGWLKPLVFKTVMPATNAAWLGVYLAVILFGIATSVAAYALLRRLTPRLLPLLTGNR